MSTVTTTRPGVAPMAGSIFLRTVVSAVLSFMLFISLSILMSAFFTETIGYRITTYAEDGTQTYEEYYYSDGDVTPYEQLKLEDNQRAVKIGETHNDVVEWIAQVLLLILLAIFPYAKLWEQGNRDRLSEKLHGLSVDRLYGLKVGALSAIPSLLAYVGLWLSYGRVLPDNYIGFYHLMNAPFIPLLNWLDGGSAVTATMPVWAVWVCLVMVLFVPIVCTVSYILGYNGFARVQWNDYNRKKKI